MIRYDTNNRFDCFNKIKENKRYEKVNIIITSIVLYLNRR